MNGAGILACALLAAGLGAAARAQNALSDVERAKVAALASANAQEKAGADKQAELKAQADAARAKLIGLEFQATKEQIDAAARAKLRADVAAERAKIDQAVLARLAAKADQAVDVTLDQPMLQAASQFLNSRDPQQAQAKKLVGKLQGVYVHSYEFSKAGQYSAGDVESLRTPFQNGQWSRVVNVRSKRDGENVDVYLKKGAEGKIGGLVVIAMKPTEVTFVNILGEIDPEDLTKLGGQFGIPALQIGKPPRPPSGEKPAPHP